MALTDIADRLTPSVPMEVTYGAQPIAAGRKFTTIFGHRAASGGTGLDYSVYTVVNVGDPVAAQTEVDGVAGTGSQLGLMAAAFISANSAAGRSNFPAFRVVLIPHSGTSFGDANEAINAVTFLRSDMFVSCYPASDDTNVGKLLTLVSLVSGVDRDLNGQFGSFATFGSLDALETAIAYDINSRGGIVAYFQDTNTALVDVTGDTVSASPTIINCTSTVGVNPGASVSGTGIPSGAFVGVGTVTPSSFGLVDVNGAPLNASAAHSAETIAVQNSVSQASEIIAAAHAGGMMSSASPYNPLQNVQVGGLIPPRKQSDWIAFDPSGASEAALIAGLSPLSAKADGTVVFIRTRTTYTTLPGEITATAYIDWQDIVNLYDFKEAMYQVSQQPPFNNNPGGTKASAIIAQKFLNEMVRVAQTFEDNGAFQNVKVLAPFFQVQVSTTSRGRFDFYVPNDVTPGLYVIAGNIQGISDITQFTL